jgi:Domain of unknown function (DUF6378)/Domain of unknown function (DUF4406)
VATYYISGPMRGKANYNRDLFNEVEHALADDIKYGGAWADSIIINPAKNFGGDTELEPNAYMNLDLKQVLQADVIVLIPGWRESPGACKEVQLAVWAGKKFWEAEQYFPVRDGDGSWAFTEADISAPRENPSPRADLLDEARALITGDRNNVYGSPIQDFTRSADAMNAYGYRGPDGRPLLPHDVAVIVTCIKLSRLMWTFKNRDSWADVAGYAGCGYECAVIEEMHGA